MLNTPTVLTLTLLVLATVNATATDTTPAVAGPMTLDAAITTALSKNPNLAELQSKAQALLAVPPQAGALPDPTLSLNALNFPTDTFDRDQEPMTQVQVALNQALPFPGKRGLRREAAEYEAAAAAAQVLDLRLQIVAAVAHAWWELLYLDRALDIVARNQVLMRDFVEIAQTKYRVGNGLQQDVLLAQLELSRLLDRELPLRSMRRAAEADLNALLDRSPGHSIRLVAEVPDINLPALLDEQQLLQTALDIRPLLDARREMTEAARTRLDLAKRDFYPDFKLGAAYGLRDGQDAQRGDRADFASLMFSVNLPIYFKSKQSKAVDQRSSEYFQRKHSFNATLRSVQASISRSRAQYEASRDQVSLYGTAIIPQAQQTVAAMLSAYQVNEVDFLNVLNAEITLYNAQISYWDALSEAKQALATLTAAIGSEKIHEQ